MIHQGSLNLDREFKKMYPPTFPKRTGCKDIVFDEQFYAISQVPSNTRLFTALNTCDTYEISVGK